MGKCKKIYKAITVCPTQAIRRISHSPQESVPATVTQGIKPAVPVQAWSDGEVPIEFVSSDPLLTSNVKEKPAMPQVAPKIELAKTYVPVQKAKPKPKLDTASPENAAVGEGKQVAITNTGPPCIKAECNTYTSGLDDKFVSDYINNAKIKMRATSDVGDGNNASGLDSFNEKVSDYINRAKVKVRTLSF